MVNLEHVCSCAKFRSSDLSQIYGVPKNTKREGATAVTACRKTCVIYCRNSACCTNVSELETQVTDGKIITLLLRGGCKACADERTLIKRPESRKRSKSACSAKCVALVSVQAFLITSICKATGGGSTMDSGTYVSNAAPKIKIARRKELRQSFRKERFILRKRSSSSQRLFMLLCTT